MANFYYKNQAGSGLPAYEGIRNQRAHGLFGDIGSFIYGNILKPVGKWLLPKALSTGKRLGSDLLKGDNFKESLKRNLRRTGEEILDEGVKRFKTDGPDLLDQGADYVKSFLQKGKGRRRRKRKRNVKRKSNKRKSVKSKKTIKRKRKTRKSSVQKKTRKSTKAAKKKSKRKKKNSFKYLF